MDFEKAAMNADKIIFKWQIYGCFFHLSQSFWCRIQVFGLTKFETRFTRSKTSKRAAVQDPSDEIPAKR